VRSKILTSSGSPRNAFAVWCPVLPVSSWSRSYSSCILRKSHFQNNGTARTAMQTPTSKTRSSTSCTAFTLSFARSPAVATAVLGGLRHFHLPFAIIFYPFSLVPFFFPPFFLIAQQHMPAVVIFHLACAISSPLFPFVVVVVVVAFFSVSQELSSYFSCLVLCLCTIYP